MNRIDLLIVEDIKEISGLLSDHISQIYPFRVVGTAKSLADARMMLNHFSVKLIILDNYLPDGTGIEFFRKLRSQGSNIDIIFITAANDIETATNAIRLGAFDYIIKPFSLDQIAETLGRYAQFHKEISLNEGSQIDQSFIKKMYNKHHNLEDAVRHPKGIDEITLQQILVVFSKDQRYTADQVSAEASVSRTTARRYLEYAVSSGYLRATIQHGKVGRPQRFFSKAIV
ncbi:response regulator [Vibrio rhizosphaerae]|uniref:Transcriptional regulatory protein n=1 Tax=Vibrio rhizosphaerae TaxID=398736 RepID=A0ABU4IU91_9VIBR|nr:response regulator [Vibrio rhizosphaerae]MDW6092697.1 response regulator [Vibrio rhizosphaerae]